ncbi:MAG: hypothetical protein ACHQT8_01010, partial [Chlamydiales bacterium]
MNIFSPSGLLKKAKFVFTFLFLLSFLALCNAFTSAPMLSKQERATLNDFFSTLLFQEGGAYNLFGNKTM